MFFKKDNNSIINKYDDLHVAIIMDGNGRWAKNKGLPRYLGHKKGAEAVQLVIECCREEKIKYLTLYAFSSENWQRSKEEIDNLMELLRYYLDNHFDDYHKAEIKVKVIGDLSKLPSDICQKIANIENVTKNNSGLNLCIALSYGSRQEIISAVKDIANDVKAGKIAIDNIDENLLDTHLYTKNIPDPDLLIRTGFEKRLSNFLLWQLAYTELVFSDILWPDFKAQNFKDALNEYKARERRYGT